MIPSQVHYRISYSGPIPLCKSSTKFLESSVLVFGSIIMVLLNSQYSSLEAALDQAGSINFYFSYLFR
jgi:hypothetical protein